MILGLALVLIASFVLYLIYRGEPFGQAAFGHGTVTFFAYVPAMAVYFLYHPVLEILMKGRTPGKRMAGVRIVSTGGRTPGVGPLLVRNIFRLVDSLPSLYVFGLAFAMFTKRHVRIGDLAAGTMLVYERKLAERDIAAIAAMDDAGRMTHRQRELVHELRQRWRELDRATRVRLATQLLKGLGEEVAPQASELAQERSLYSRLEELAQESVSRG